MRIIHKVVSIFLILLVAASTQTQPSSGMHTTRHVEFSLLDVTWGEKTAPLEPEPGDTALPLIIALTPSGVLRSTLKITGLTATITYTTPSITAPDGSSSEKDIVEGIFTVGQRVEFRFTSNLDKKMPLGTYSADLRIDFNVVDGASETGDQYLLKIPLKILGRPDIKYRLEPSILAPAALNAVALIVENNGSAPAYGLETTFIADKTTILNGTSPWTTASLSAKSSTRLPFTLYVHPDLENRVAKATASTKYRSSQGTILKAEKQIYFTVEARKNLFKQTLTITVKGGTENEGSIILTYTGKETLNKLDITLTATPPSSITGTSTWIFNQIRQDDNIHIPVKLLAEKSSRIATLTATIQYSDPMGSTIKETLEQSFTVEANPESSTMIRATNIQIDAGGITMLKLLLTNNRSSIIKNVNIEAQVSQPFSIIGSNTWSYKELTKEQTVELQLSLYAPASALGSSVGLSVTIRYLDQVGTSLSDSHKIGLTASRSLRGGSVSFEPEGLELTAGADNTVTIAMRNLRSFELRDIQVTARATEPLRIIGTTSWSLASIKPSDRTTFSVRLLVSAQLAGSSGQVTFTAEYYDSFGEKSQESRTIGFSIPRGVISTSPITISLSNADVKRGAVNRIHLSLSNVGNTPLRDFDMKVSLLGLATIVGSEGRLTTKTLGISSVTIMELPILVLDEISTTSITLQFDIAYSDAVGETHTENRRIALAVASTSASPVLISSSTSDIVAGSRFNYTLIISNKGDHAVSDVEVKAEAPSTVPISGIEPRWVLGRIMPGEERKLSLPVFAFDKTAGSTGSFIISTSYSDNGVLRSERKTLGFTVVGVVDLRVTDINFTPQPMFAGSRFTVAGTLFNAGNVDAKAVNIGFPSTDIFLRDSAGTQVLVGDVSAGSQVPFSLSGIISTEAKLGSYPLKLAVSFKDDRGSLRSLEISENAQIAAAGAEQRETNVQPLLSTPSILIGLVIGAVLTSLVIFVLRRR
ncbi:MAG: hypothetical protein HYU39_10640 [Thaumarchaeota archaeon]|nr:hypothetical protein [Nitrososphaerota archaeon]